MFLEGSISSHYLQFNSAVEVLLASRLFLWSDLPESVSEFEPGQTTPVSYLNNDVAWMMHSLIILTFPSPYSRCNEL